jgi:hypothetical protein
MSARVCASPESLLAPATLCRCRKPRRLERVDREHLTAGCDQTLNPPSPIGLDAHRYLVGASGLIGRAVKMLAKQRMQSGHPGHAPGQPGLASRRPDSS